MILLGNSYTWKRDTFINIYVVCGYTFFILDEITIAIYSRLYELRLCVLLDNKYWVARIGDKPEHCDIKLAFLGKLQFEDSVRMLHKVSPLLLNPLVVIEDDDTGNNNQTKFVAATIVSKHPSVDTQLCVTMCAPNQIIDFNNYSQESQLAVNSCAPLVSNNNAIEGTATSVNTGEIIDFNNHSQESQLDVNLWAPLVSNNNAMEETAITVNMGEIISDLQPQVVLHRMTLDENLRS